jgi:hypothetical protein
MASYGGLTLTHEALGERPGRFAPNSSGRTVMLVDTGLWLIALGMVALSLESFGAALSFFGCAVWLIVRAS